MTTPGQMMIAALNKLCKWRSVLVGWQLGSRAMNDPESAALRDQQDARLVAPIDDFELALRALQHEMLARTEKADCLKKVQWLAEVFGIEKDNTPQS